MTIEDRPYIELPDFPQAVIKLEEKWTAIDARLGKIEVDRESHWQKELANCTEDIPNLARRCLKRLWL